MTLQPLSPGNYQLRPYQADLIQAIYHQWATGKNRVMAQLPTGGGKTVLFAEIAKQSISQGEKVLVLAHREELILQSESKMESIAKGIAEIGIVKAGYRPNYEAQIQVASVQSMVNRLDQVQSVGLIVVDEAHHATADTYRKVLANYPQARILGVTATPIRLDGTGFRELFDELVCGVSVSELIDGGHLSKYKLLADPSPMITKGARKQQGDFNMADVAQLNDAIELANSLVSSYVQYANGLKCVVFAVSVAHSQTTAEAYNLVGIPALHLDGDTSSEDRAKALGMFASGEIKVISNCSLFDEGLDIPSIEVVQIAKPTKSLGRYLQMLGRGLRPAKGKEQAILIDHTRNWEEHGLPTDKRIWTLDGVEIPERKRRLIRKPDGEVVERERVEKVEVVKLELVDIGAQAEADKEALAEFKELAKVQQQSGYKLDWLYFRLREKPYPLSVWKAFGRLKGYKSGWAWHRWKEQEEGINQGELELG